MLTEQEMRSVNGGVWNWAVAALKAAAEYAVTAYVEDLVKNADEHAKKFDLANQLEVHSIQQLAPFDITVIHKTIEHVLLTTEQAA